MTASTFLIVLALGTLAVLGAPMMLWPLTWARRLRWHIPAAAADQHLAIYFGRCLGAVACVLSGGALVAAREPALQPFFFDLIVGIFAAMVGVHGWGALRRIQPVTETVETLAWAALLVVALIFHP